MVTVDKRVRDAGLRPTRQRVALGNLLFAKGDRHLSAEELHEEALAAGVPVSLATVYNALHQFTEAGLLRILAVEGSKTYFDTNTSDHHHFFIEGENKIFDIAAGPVEIVNLPEPPEGMEIANVDIVVGCVPSGTDEGTELSLRCLHTFRTWMLLTGCSTQRRPFPGSRRQSLQL